MHTKKQTKGFTIVELLIVIVVIGILAAITIVAYNGVTAKANATSANSLATLMAKKIEIYRSVTGQIPTFDEFQNNRAIGSTVNNSGPVEARIDPTDIISVAPGSGNGTTAVRFVSNGCGSTFIDYWDYVNGRVTTYTTTPQSKFFAC